MSAIKEFLMDVEEMYTTGNSAEEISKATGFPVSYIEDVIKNLELDDLE